MPLSHLAYELPELGKLEPSILSLGVPVVKDAVQMGVVVEDKKRLSVRVEPPRVTISREDGTPLSIDEVREHRSPVLVKPVAELVLYQAEEDGVWEVSPSGDLSVQDPEALGRFLNLIAAFAQNKQVRQHLALRGIYHNQ